MKTVRSRKQRFWHRLWRQRSLVVPSQQGLPLIGADSAILTHLELADAHGTAIACRSVEQQHNKRAAAMIDKLANSADRIGRVIKDYVRRANDHIARTEELHRVDAILTADGLHMRGQRRMGRTVRWIAVIGLGVLDITAYRSAMEIVFNTSDENFAGIVESYLLAMLSMGMVIAAAFCGASIRHYLDAKAHAEHQLEGAASAKATRREALVTGVSAGAIAIVSMISGATMRLQGMQAAQPTPISSGTAMAVTIISGLALFGAFLVEMKWASEVLDKYDRLRHSERRTRRKLTAAEARLQPLQTVHRVTIERALNAWASFQPTWEAQIDSCTERVHRARGHQPAAFTLVGASVRATIEQLVAHGDTRMDVAAIIAERKLTFDDVVSPLHALSPDMDEHMGAATPAEDDEDDSLPIAPAETELVVPDDARELDSVVAEEAHDNVA